MPRVPQSLPLDSANFDSYHRHMGIGSDYLKHGIWRGTDIADHLGEIVTIKGALNAIGICIDTYIDTDKRGSYKGVLQVMGNPQPTGFKFFCKDVLGLKARVQKLKDQLKLDDRGTLSGLANASQAKGDSFRQSGVGIGLHIEVGDITDCHLDSHQIVAGSVMGFGTVYNFDAIADHFTFDLAPELPILKYAYIPLGKSASIGPYFAMKLNRPDPYLHDPGGEPDRHFEFGAGVSVRGTFGANK